MVGDDPLRGRTLGGRGRHLADAVELGEDGSEDLGFVAALFALEDRGDAFEAHPGIDVFAGKELVFALGVLVVLHENVVPDFDPALVGGVKDRGRLAAAGPVEHLGVRAAGAGLAGGAPPVVFFAKLGDAFGGDAERIPELPREVVKGGVLVAREDRHRQHFERDIEVVRPGQEFEAEADRVFLEVVAERPVAEHFKKGQMHRVADFVDIAGADALLAVGQPGAEGMRRALEIRHQGVHPGGGKQTRRVVVRDQRRAFDLFVAFGDEKVEVFPANFYSFHIQRNAFVIGFSDFSSL